MCLFQTNKKSTHHFTAAGVWDKQRKKLHQWNIIILYYGKFKYHFARWDIVLYFLFTGEHYSSVKFQVCSNKCCLQGYYSSLWLQSFSMGVVVSEILPNWEGVKFDYKAEFGWKRVFRVSSVNLKVIKAPVSFFIKNISILRFTQSSFTITVIHLLCFIETYVKAWTFSVFISWFLGTFQLTENVWATLFDLKNSKNT